MCISAEVNLGWSLSVAGDEEDLVIKKSTNPTSNHIHMHDCVAMVIVILMFIHCEPR